MGENALPKKFNKSEKERNCFPANTLSANNEVLT